MRASVAAEGIPLVGAEALPWAHFLSRTWRELEDFYGISNMRLDLYRAETTRTTAAQDALLARANAILGSGRAVMSLEQSGVLHALQVLIENAIGKGKQLVSAQALSRDAYSQRLTHSGLSLSSNRANGNT